MKKTMLITMLVILVAVGVFTAGCSTNKIPTGNNAQGTRARPDGDRRGACQTYPKSRGVRR